MSSVSTFLAVVIPVNPRLSFLDLPPEIRCMIYDDVLPDVIRVQPQNDSGFAILRTSRQIYKEAFNVLKKRTSLFLKVQDRQTRRLAHRWIAQLNSRSASTIRNIEIDTWIDISTRPRMVVLHRWLFSISLGAPSGHIIKHRLLDNGDLKPQTFMWAEHANDTGGTYSTPFHPELFFENFSRVTYKLFGAEERSDGVMHKSGLKMIVDAILDYGEHSYLWRHDEHWSFRELRVASVRKWSHPLWGSSDNRNWKYLYPRMHPDEAVQESEL
ncbi:MAG: hypothetical protein Q9181_005509 [Wetmoreana brouardii]